MPEDVGDSPYPDGADHGGADDAFAAVVFDEAFVRAATVHEPSAHERMLAAVEARLELEATGAGRAYGGADDPRDPADDGLPEELRPYRGDEDDLDWPGPAVHRSRLSGRRAPGPRGRRASAHARWHRPVAWFLAVVMGLGVVAVAVAAVYRGTTGPATPAPSRPDSGSFGSPAADVPRPPVVSAPSAASGG
ncbi:hypothetical protein [Streptomyces sp. NPDC001380]|uniref:SCO2584 family spore wall biosynthesis protein n=1 Tax=Streptomyces sp. NPDC001380 TaxID=3364566 RepID=UPI0036CCA864